MPILLEHLLSPGCNEAIFSKVHKQQDLQHATSSSRPTNCSVGVLLEDMHAVRSRSCYHASSACADISMQVARM